jgi:hypothetical protein
MTSRIERSEDANGGGQHTFSGEQMTDVLASHGAVDPVCAEVLTSLSPHAENADGDDRLIAFELNGGETHHPTSLTHP